MEKQVNKAERQDAIPSVERRFFQSEARAKKSESGELRIGGYGAIFNKYTNMGWYAEVVMPGFFDEIKSDRCACLLNHDSNHVLGRTANNTLELKIDATGLEYEAKLPASRADVHELIQEGYIYESSFAFTTLKSAWEEVDRSLLVGLLSEADLDQLSYGGKVTVRRLEKGKELFDVSPVTFAAYEGTTTDTRIAKRSFDAWKAEEQHSAPPPEQVPNHRRLILEAKMRSAT